MCLKHLLWAGRFTLMISQEPLAPSINSITLSYAGSLDLGHIHHF